MSIIFADTSCRMTTAGRRWAGAKIVEKLCMTFDEGLRSRRRRLFVERLSVVTYHGTRVFRKVVICLIANGVFWRKGCEGSRQAGTKRQSIGTGRRINWVVGYGEESGANL